MEPRRGSAPWWGLLVAMLLSGSGSAMGAADDGDPVLTVFAAVAFAAAIVAAVMIVRTWRTHRRSGSTTDS